MEDGGSKSEVKKTFDRKPVRKILNVGDVFQSFWVRCRSVFPNTTDGKFMESELRYVLYCGIFFWMLHLLWQAIK